MRNNKIGVISLTYNRLNKLKKVLESYDNQEYKPEFVLVYNNCSTDGTADYLKQWQEEVKEYDKYVITSDKNYGGAGGFHNAMEEALKHSFDWLWIADDDAYAQNDTLLRLNDSINKYGDKNYAISGTVYEFGEINYSHRRTIKHTIIGPREKRSLPTDYKKDYFKIDIFSFVGAAIRREVFEQIGLPRGDMFIWYDDTEFSIRVSKKYGTICVPSIIINHDPDKANNELSWKNYYGTRNKLYTYYKHFNRLEYGLFMLRFNYRHFKMKKKNKKEYELIKEAKKRYKDKVFTLNDKYMPGKKI